MLPKREFKPRLRGRNLRDAKLIVIAAEGTQTEKKYFEAVVSAEKFRNPKVHVKVLERLSTASDPAKVMEQLDGFRREFSLNRYDELWMVIDFDRWGEQKLGAIAQACRQKEYLLAVSNPCFELWLLLHVCRLSDYTAEELERLLQNEKVGRDRRAIEMELVRLLGSYNKGNPDCSRFLPSVETAIAQAQTLDTNPEHRWPNDLGTRVYLVVKTIMG
jgi:hypothetical protein